MTVRSAVPVKSVPRIGMSIDDLALSLGVSPNSIRKMVEEGALPPPRIWGKRRIWRTVEIDAALSEWPIDGEDQNSGAPDDWRGRV